MIDYRTDTLIRREVEVAQLRLRRRGGVVEGWDHFRRPVERPFTAEERSKVTILFGGMTPAHETLIQAALRSCGYSAEPLPQPDLDACLVGRQYGNNGVCNPAYFTVGNLVKYLISLESRGLTRPEIIDRYVYLTAGGCGPCRYGMYEDEYRLALRNAGFGGFRVILFQQTEGTKAKTGEPGFKLSLHLGLNVLNAFTLADAARDFGYCTRPFETVAGGTARAIDAAMGSAARLITDRRPVTPEEQLPRFTRRFLRGHPKRHDVARILVNIHDQIWGSRSRHMVKQSAEPFAGLEVDRLRVKPVVKVIGEFWAQTTESAGNFNMLAFLEREGAEVMPEPVSSWVLFLLSQARAKVLDARGLDVPFDGPRLKRWRAAVSDRLSALKKLAAFAIGQRVYFGVYDRARAALGGVPHALVDPRLLADRARPFYHELARGGESYLEIGKRIYYTQLNRAHLVLSLKPFGCMPSLQSDGVQALVTARFKDALFLPIETSPEGEFDAHSRVQVALLEARSRAQAEFDQALAGTGKRLDDIRAFVAGRPDLRRATYHVPHRTGVAGTAAHFVWHVSDLMNREGRRSTRH